MSSSTKKSSRSGSSSKSNSGSKSGSRSGSSSGSKISSKSDRQSNSTATEGGNEEEWTDWEWSSEYECNYRSRVNKDGILEYEYDYLEQDKIPAEKTPRVLGLRSVQEEQEGDAPFSTPAGENLSPDSVTEHETRYNTTTQNVPYQNDPQLKGLGRDLSNFRVNSSLKSDDSGGYGGASLQPSVDHIGGSRDPVGQNYSVSSTPPAWQYMPPPPQAGSALIPRTFSDPLSTSHQTAPQWVHSGSTDTDTVNRYISGSTQEDDGTPDTDTLLHKGFQVYSSRHFRFGKVFKIVWSEPKGQGLPGNAKRTDVKVHKSKFGEEYYTSIRRFVIIKEDHGYSLCLPIYTYGNQGTGKPGVKPQNHAIIYTEDKARKGEVPKMAPKEVKLTHKPIRMEPKTSRDQLSPYSRLNYAKIYTVEHNVKVCFIGTIHEKSVKEFKRSYNLQHKPIPEDDSIGYEEDVTGEHTLGGHDTEASNAQEWRNTEASNAQELRETASQVEETAPETI